MNLEDESEFASMYMNLEMTITPESIEKRRIFSRDLGHNYLQQICRDVKLDNIWQKYSCIFDNYGDNFGDNSGDNFR